MACGSPFSHLPSAASSVDTAHPVKLAVCLGTRRGVGREWYPSKMSTERLRDHQNSQVVSVDGGTIG